jgi:chaperonin cofactor prefoldin
LVKINNKNKNMSEINKLTEEELQQIKELQSQYNKFIFELGSIEAQLQNILATKLAIETEKNNTLEDIKKLGEREKELVSTLQEKYGQGSIDIETGEVTSA